MEKEVQVQEYSKIQWFFMVIFIPIVFALILFGVLLNFMGINVLNEAKQVASNIPIVSDYIKSEEQLLEEEKLASLEELTTAISSTEQELKGLQQQLVAKDDEIALLIEEIEMLMVQLEQKQEAELEIVTEYQEIAKLYETMSAKNAANILNELNEEEAAVHLSFVKMDARAAILAKMNPDKAAQLISLLTSN